MRGNAFLDKMEFVDPAYIEAAGRKTAVKRRSLAKWGAIAACLALAVYAAGRMLLRSTPKTPAELPVLTVSGNGHEGNGFEFLMAYDSSELINGNPWNETMELHTLPVYRNQIVYGEAPEVTLGKRADMKAFLLEVAARLGYTEEAFVITDDGQQTEEEDKATVTTLIGKADGITITVYPGMTAMVEFTPAIRLPEGYNFAHYAPYQDILEVAQYLEKAYPTLIGMKNPQMDIYGGDYNIYCQQGYDIKFFDGTGDAVNQIVNYNFHNVAFYCNDEGDLFLARVWRPDLTQKVGEYPIISADEAKALLLNGHYITTVPDELPGANSVVKVELVYRTGDWEAYYMPYYRFYVELPERTQEGMKWYGAYYVPAVESRYISNMPLWDGRFN